MPRPDFNYLTGPELSQVGEIVEFLNKMQPPKAQLSVEIKLYDSNGEKAGMIGFSEAGAYVYYPPEVL